ncbi:MAG: hypothetical protein CVV45_09310 [Spirochaetae bacterium HGW-Spirochaetae-10]|nr:MAG: hypothetical protein CVV45_09310 [Spirochaetae bacterium HGW-Spirochaetae-10]
MNGIEAGGFQKNKYIETPVRNRSDRMIQFEEERTSPTSIKVVGVGGGGMNAVNRMIDAGIPDDYLDESFQTFAFNGWDDPHRVFVEYAQLFAENRDRTLVVLGKPGVGKTHVACSMLREMIVQGSTALYVTEGALLRQIRSTFSKKGGPTEEDVFRRYTSCDVLVMDEMGIAPWSEYSVQSLADIIDTRVSRKKKTVFLGNMDLGTFKKHLSDASISRISMGKTFEVTGDDYRKLKKRQGRV